MAKKPKWEVRLPRERKSEYQWFQVAGANIAIERDGRALIKVHPDGYSKKAGLEAIATAQRIADALNGEDAK